ncbi:metal-dependent transcriptional regulator [Spirochaeta cellobiosiphila]|uniref:metal-dependent transcriptional regulator n=1 Tax=Spirochaeta cellobiosiphila TaxID=504483 RepID=UPI000408B903|nr:metal-dependent transcriptional regulator [Spirochaeta cellobiosiphila]
MCSEILDFSILEGSEDREPHFRVRDQKKISSAMEEYLLLIFDLSDQTSGRIMRVSTKHIADKMNVKQSSVTSMLKKMAEVDPPLVEYQKHQGVILTTAGRREALQALRNHRLLELFLHDIMGFAWDEVHDEALRLQHAISPHFTNKMAELLDHPQFDPHGAPIPDEDLYLPPQHNIRLLQMKPNQLLRITSVPDDNPLLLRHLDEAGLRPGSVCQIAQINEDSKTIECIIGQEHEAKHVLLDWNQGLSITVELAFT